MTKVISINLDLRVGLRVKNFNEVVQTDSDSEGQYNDYDDTKLQE